MKKKFGANQISIVNEMLRSEVEETDEFIKQRNTFKEKTLEATKEESTPNAPEKKHPMKQKKEMKI